MSAQKTLDEAKHTVVRVTASTREKVVRTEEWTIEIPLAGRDTAPEARSTAQLQSLQLPRST